MRHPFYFIIPNPKLLASGGNIYNQKLIEALKKNNLPIKVMDWTGFWENPFPEKKACYLFDSLYFDRLTGIPKAPTTALSLLIVHHLESLYPPQGWSSTAYFSKNEFPVLRKMDGFLTTSRFTATYLEQNGLSQPSIIIPPAPRFFPKQHFDRTFGQVRALMVSNLVARKGLLPFLENMMSMETHFSSFPFSIDLIGSEQLEKDYAHSCLQIIQNNKTFASRVKFRGTLQDEALSPFFSKANLFLSTSYMETYGMAVQEARIFKIPVLALNRGNLKYHVNHRQNGYLTDSIAELVTTLFEMVKKPEILATLHRKIRQEDHTEFHIWKEVAKDFTLQFNKTFFYRWK